MVFSTCQHQHQASASRTSPSGALLAEGYGSSCCLGRCAANPGRVIREQLFSWGIVPRGIIDTLW